jgi:glycosyltransferase involved in cell wall biosynthesis
MGLTILSVAFPFARVEMDATGGAEQVLAMLDRAIVAAGWRSVVVAQEGSRISGTLLAARARRGLIDGAGRAQTHADVRALIERAMVEHRPDVIHLHGLDFAAYGPPPGPPALITLHLPFAWYDPPALTPERPDTVFNAVSHWQARQASGVDLAAVIENGVDIPPPRPRPKAGFALALGRICPEKGFHEALDAAKAADMPMILAGEAFPYAEHQHYLAREILPRLDARRRWVGPVRGAAKRRLLSAARCLVAPSKAPETASLVAREALAAGTPVVAYRQGALTETIRDGVTGLLVDTVGEMARAISAAAGLDSRACRAEAAGRFSAERMSAAYLDLYARLAAAKPGLRITRLAQGPDRLTTPLRA